MVTLWRTANRHRMALPQTPQNGPRLARLHAKIFNFQQ